mmetsp:Transcript_71799/g.153503  ORF Transcript_71799/g.153503 Transcript_71799/m.153503 type:complete len:291 (-) Transcript_71799:459-1331(-)
MPLLQLVPISPQFLELAFELFDLLPQRSLTLLRRSVQLCPARRGRCRHRGGARSAAVASPVCIGVVLLQLSQLRLLASLTLLGLPQQFLEFLETPQGVVVGSAARIGLQPTDRPGGVLQELHSLLQALHDIIEGAVGVHLRGALFCRAFLAAQVRSKGQDAICGLLASWPKLAPVLLVFLLELGQLCCGPPRSFPLTLRLLTGPCSCGRGGRDLAARSLLARLSSAHALHVGGPTIWARLECLLLPLFRHCSPVATVAHDATERVLEVFPRLLALVVLRGQPCVQPPHQA